jgi:protein ImuB
LYFDGNSRSEILRVAEACLRWTPQIAVSDEAVFLEIGRCRGIYSEETLALRLRALAKRFGCSFKISFAGDAPRALALARLGQTSSLDVILPSPSGVILDERMDLPVESLLDYVNPFGLDPEEIRHVREMSVTLRKLGIETLSEFLALPAKMLPSRFGKLGLLLHQRVREAASIPWPRFMPPERVIEKAQFEAEQFFQDLEPLIFALKPVMDRAMARLRGRGERVTSLRIRLRLERYSSLSQEEASRSWNFSLALPQGSSLGLIPVLRERLGFDLARNPLPSPVTDLELEVLETAPGVGSQRDFFNAREEEIEAWNSLIARLAEKLGEGRVFLAEPVERYLPEKSWVKRSELSLDESGSDGGELMRQVHNRHESLPDRPLRVLKQPIPIYKEGGSIRLPDSSRQWRVVQAEGPEVLSGEWWFQQFQRSYFRLATDSGEDLWVFQTPLSETLYLHGYFD